MARGKRKADSGIDARKGRLVAMVSHELRNPLNTALVAACTLVNWPGLPAPAREMALVIKRNVELEARLVDGLLKLAQSPTTRIEVDEEPTAVRELIHQANTASGTVSRLGGDED